MSNPRNLVKLIGAIVGIAVMGGAVYSVFFIDWEIRATPEPPMVRPLKTMVIESPFSSAARKYPGKVRANEEVKLAFQVPGQLIEFPVKKGLDVDKGDLLGRLDPRDYENELATRQATLDAARFEYKRIEGLDKRGMAAEKELMDSKAAFESAVAALKIARKALDDTCLRAPFAGVVADTYVDNFQNIQAKVSVLSLQEIDRVEIVVSVPEERVIRAPRSDDDPADPAERGERANEHYRFAATLEYLPNREFDVRFKEFTSEADPVTQTYAATFAMPVPGGVTILPGMTATIHEYQRETGNSGSAAYAVPLDAVPLDGQGAYFVWSVRDAGDGTATVHRVDVQVGEMVGDDILVSAGLKSGDRIALAGVHLLQEGQRVRPFTAQEDAAP